MIINNYLVPWIWHEWALQRQAKYTPRDIIYWKLADVIKRTHTWSQQLMREAEQL